MLYAKYNRSLQMDSVKSTASVKLTVARESASSVRHEYFVGGDLADLLVLIDKIKRQKCSVAFRIIAESYTKNGKVYRSQNPGHIVFYHNKRYEFAELHYNGEMVIEQGARAGEVVSSYKMVPPAVWVTVDNLFWTDRSRFDAMSPQTRDAYLMGTLIEVPASFKPAVVDPRTGTLAGLAPIDSNHESDEEQDAIDGLNEPSEAPETDANGDEILPF